MATRETDFGLSRRDLSRRDSLFGLKLYRKSEKAFDEITRALREALSG